MEVACRNPARNHAQYVHSPASAGCTATTSKPRPLCTTTQQTPTTLGSVPLSPHEHLRHRRARATPLECSPNDCPSLFGRSTRGYTLPDVLRKAVPRHATRNHRVHTTHTTPPTTTYTTWRHTASYHCAPHSTSPQLPRHTCETTRLRRTRQLLHHTTFLRAHRQPPPHNHQASLTTTSRDPKGRIRISF